MHFSARALAAILLCVWICLTGCNAQKPTAAPKANAERRIAPEFRLTDANGRTVSLAEYKGKVVLLNFWATSCGPCKIEIPWFVEFEQKYKSRGFAVLGVAMDEDGWEAVKPYLGQARINYKVLLGNESVATLYGGIEALPTSFVLDQEGRIAATHIGLVDKREYEKEIAQLLEGVRAALPTQKAGH